MIVADIEKIVETWAPKRIAWERDNPGLQFGDPSKKVSSILLALDATKEVALEAIRLRVDLVLTHHPLFFRPLSSLTYESATGRVALPLIEKKIALYSAHTNLDFTRGGVSWTLAEHLGLQSPSFLTAIEPQSAKVVVFVPSSHTEAVLRAMSDAGAGIIGNYSECSFVTEGSGTFLGNEEANPSVGKKGRREWIPEQKLEMVVPRSSIRAVVDAMLAVHPYEEPAYDVYPMLNPESAFGMGVIGSLKESLSVSAFLTHVKRTLGAQGLRYVKGKSRSIRTVAVCGGGGADLAREALRRGADAYVTADVKYHAFQELTGSLLLVDAGHWETERLVLEELRKRLLAAADERKSKISVHLSKVSQNPIQYFYS